MLFRSVAAGNQGFWAIGDWLKIYREELIKLLKPEKERLPSYSTIRRVLLTLDYQKYSQALGKFFKVNPQKGETIAADGKVLRGSYQLEKDNPNSPSHPSIMLVTGYLVERGLILPPYEVESKTNEIKALPEFIQQLALKGVVFAFDAISTQKKTCALIVETENDYLGALKGNQGNLHKQVKANFSPQESYVEVNKGHGRIEKRVVNISRDLSGIPDWPGLKTLIQVQSERRYSRGGKERVEQETRYYITSLEASAEDLARRIRGYWGVENKVHYVRDVTQGEDASRVRMNDLPHLFAIARNLALNLYRNAGFTNMAQAQRFCRFALDTLLPIFKMK